MLLKRAKDGMGAYGDIWPVWPVKKLPREGGGGVIGGGGVLPYEKMTWMLVVSLGSIYLQGVRQTFT